MLKELDFVVLDKDIDAHGLQNGDIGTIVHCYENGSAYEVEFVSANGKTIAVVTLSEQDIRPLYESEIFHARNMSVHEKVRVG